MRLRSRAQPAPSPPPAPTPSPEALLRRLEWRVIRLLDGRLQGSYRSLFRGAGLDFTDLREYEAGDDLRHIDWNVTARTDTPHVRVFVEDREVSAWLLLDRSASMGFGPVDRQKNLVLAEIATTVAQVLSRSGSRVGAVLFDTEVEQTIRPAQGRTQVLRIADALLHPPTRTAAPTRATDPARTRTDLAVLLRAALGVARRRSLLIIVSDFISEPGWAPALSLLTRRHDVVALQVVDPREHDLPAVGMIYVEDAETGEQIFVDSDDPVFRARLRDLAQERQDELVASTRTAGTELHRIGTDEDLVRALARISDLRRRQRR